MALSWLIPRYIQMLQRDFPYSSDSFLPRYGAHRIVAKKPG